MKPEKHFARVEPVRAASILSAARSERLRLLFCVSERKATESGDTVDEDGAVLIEMLEFAADTCKMCFGVTCSRGKREVWTADPACQVARRRPVVNPHGIERQILHGEIASFDVDEEHARRIKRA